MHAVTARLLALFLLVVATTGCAATVDRTDLAVMTPGIRPDPPRKENNNVYVDFRDLTASGVEDPVFEGLEEAILDRGWNLTNDYYTADYVLWADLRLFGEAGTEAGNQALSGLGAVSAGAATGYVVARATDNAWAGVGAGSLTAGITKVAMDWMLQRHSYQMVVDLVLGRKIEGGVQTKQSSGKDSALVTNAAAGTGLGTERSSSSATSEMRQDLEEERVHFDLEQRLLAVAEGRRLTKDMARDALIPKLIEGLKSQLPRVR